MDGKGMRYFPHASMFVITNVVVTIGIRGTGLDVSLTMVGVALGVVWLIFGLMYYCFKDDSYDVSEVDIHGVRIIRGQSVGILGKIIRSKIVTFGLPFATGFIGTSAFRDYGLIGPVIVILISLVALVAIILLDSTIYSKEEEPKDESADSYAEEIIAPKQCDTSLEYLSAYCQSASMDGLIPHVRSIVKRATKLLSYQKDDGVVGEILQAYRIFIEQYVAKAAELIRKYQIAKGYLSTTDCNQLSIEIGYLQTDIESGDASAKTTLDEKLTTKAEIEAMRKRQESIGRRLGEIAATLEAMEVTVVSAETSDADAKDVRDELQRTLSSTTMAIKETLCDHEK